MLKRKAQNDCIQITQPIKQKKRNLTKIPTPAEVRMQLDITQTTKTTTVNRNYYIVIFPLAFVNLI